MAELWILARRKAGALLTKMEKDKGGRPKKNSQRGESFDIPSATATHYRKLACRLGWR